MIVTLTHDEMLTAAFAGIRRRISALSAGRKDRGVWKMGHWDSDVESCGSELAVAKMFDAYWHDVRQPEDFYDGDVRGWEVRWTKYKDGHLVIAPDDPDERCFVFVVGLMPVYNVVGWIQCSEAKKKKYLRPGVEGRPELKYWVPQKALKEFDMEPEEEAA